MQKSRRLSHIQEVLDSTVRVEEGGAHGYINIGSCEAHALHVGHDGLALVAHSQSGGIIEARPRCLCSRRGRRCGGRIL
jgi:hypothetical protein